MHSAIGTTIAAALVALALSAGAAKAADCASKPGLTAFASDGWGIDARNTRFQPKTTITAANVGRLRLKWVLRAQHRSAAVVSSCERGHDLCRRRRARPSSP
jgi:hypothetical protein